ncbi:glutathione S-transferase Gst1 [Schizosaccharomyces japonicus yFS275]|uniref:glutathione transferase n=1 Tax=Schizosaccharomyces japonicus (strain yFS275 / FY16936) TaxID=402676 RepID=B6JV37_SCHJY|nr:glutathione S-transferase Gst1 [Schizosaccharomyces japonicus yFS275]EEB05238.1 glutathione S-transferase Gst1 [Schizosaccharomyces japonicus yFS275]
MAQFTLYTHKGGPNPWKAAMCLKELGLTYESVYLDFQKNEQKNPQHLKLNPNGRVPTLVDHLNNDYTIWESDAVLLYLTDRYDKQRAISLPHDHPDYHHELQYLFFQSSGQGVIWGQANWFNIYHPVPVPSAVTRYRNELKRVLGVLETILQDKPYLLGDKFTIADLSFVTWNNLLSMIFGKGKYEWDDQVPQLDFQKEFPKTYDWNHRINQRQAIAKTNEEKAKIGGH